MSRRFAFLSALALAMTFLALPACSSSGGSGAPADAGPTGSPSAPCVDGEPGCIGWRTCPPAFTPDPAGSGCREILPEAACPAGTMPVLGESACVPVGPASCPDGFAKASSGWGCEAIMPAKACTGATRDALGNTTCVPVGDCDAAFPPPNATMFVNGAFTDGELGPTKFRTVTDALAAAGSGAVVAVYDGTYAEGIAPRAPATVIGRCPAKVRFVGTGLSVWGVIANRVKNVVVRGVTLEDHYEGGRAQGGGTLTLTDSVIESPRFVGLIAFQANSSIRAERVVIRNTKPQPNQTVLVASVNADGGGTVDLESSALTNNYQIGITVTNPDEAAKVRSTVRMNHSIVRDTNIVEHGTAGVGVVVSGVSTAVVTESAIVDTRRIGTIALDSTSLLDVQRSVIRGSFSDSGDSLSGGAFISEGGVATYTDVTMRGLTQSGIIARTEGKITMTRSVIEDTRAGADGIFGMGAFIDLEGQLTMTDSAVVGNSYYGISVRDPKSTANLTRVLVTDTKRDRTDGFGRGVNVEDGAKLQFDGLSLLRNGDQSLFVRGETKTGKRATGEGTRLLVMDTKPRKDGSTGSGINVEMGALFSLDGAAVIRARRAGILINDSLGEAGSPAEATLTHVVVRDTREAGDGLGAGNLGVGIEGAGIANGGKLTLRSSAVIGSVEFGVVSANEGSTAVVESCTVAGTTALANGEFGHGIVATGDSSLVVRATDIRENRIGLAFNSATGIVASCRVERNEVGIHAQKGSAIESAATAPDVATTNAVVVTEDTTFVDNGTRIGSGEVPLPQGFDR